MSTITNTTLSKENISAILSKRKTMRTNNKNRNLHIPMYPAEMVKEFWKYGLNPITGAPPSNDNFTSGSREQTEYLPTRNRF